MTLIDLVQYCLDINSADFTININIDGIFDLLEVTVWPCGFSIENSDTANEYTSLILSLSDADEVPIEISEDCHSIIVFSTIEKLSDHIANLYGRNQTVKNICDGFNKNLGPTK